MDTIPYTDTYAAYRAYFKDVYLLDEYEGRYDSANVSIDGIEDRDLNPLCQTAESYYLSATKAGDLFTNGINFVGDLPESLKGFLFFYHGDHLGSASWITDVNGDPVQYLHYAPYGELVDNRNNDYDERFKFTDEGMPRLGIPSVSTAGAGIAST